MNNYRQEKTELNLIPMHINSRHALNKKYLSIGSQLLKDGMALLTQLGSENKILAQQ